MTRYIAVLLACVVASFRPPPAFAQQATSLPAAHGSTDSVQARALLLRMAERLARAQRFSVSVQEGYDVLQASGQKIEFGEVRQVLLSRPDKLRVDVTQNDGSKKRITFDRRDLTIFDPQANVFAELVKPGDADGIIRYVVEDLQTPIPLSLLLLTSLPQQLERRVTEIALVDHETLAGTPVDHLAGRMADVDFEVWITRRNESVPLRVIITYKDAAGQPQFRAMLTAWNFNPRIDPAAFAFTPPTGAESVAIFVRRPAQAEPGGSGDKP